MIWARGESMSRVSGPWIVAKVIVCGVDRYELRHTARPEYVAAFASFDSAKREGASDATWISKKRIQPMPYLRQATRQRAV